MKPPVFDPSWHADVQALYNHDMEEIWDRNLQPHLWNQYHNQLSCYLSLIDANKLRVLDVGCAQGTLALLLAEKGHDVTAVDIRPQFLDYAKSRYTHGDIQFVQANVLEDDLPGEYDLIFANQIIEHLVYPQQFVNRLTSLLLPSGRLVVTTPNGGYLKNDLPSFRQLGDPSDWEYLQHSADGDGHFYAYSADELFDIFLEANLDFVRIKLFESPFISGHMKIRYLHSWMPSSVLRLADRALLATPILRSLFAHQLMIVGCRLR